jgi:Fic family protein
MSLKEKLQQINELQEAINTHGKIPVDILKKINYKFRLEWNYTSNSMEGNSLTRNETRSVMIGNITVDNKPLKDILEIKGHDEVVVNILKIGKGELNISERRIRDIHRSIMNEDDPAKKDMPGNWKKVNNYLYSYKKERIDFAPPEDVPVLMHDLVNKLNAAQEKITRGDKDSIHPLILASRFHLDFVTIHPFYDGNGRMSRILSNMILVTNGYPPFYIKENERLAYYQYLGDIQVYGGDADLFYEYMAGLLLRSVQIQFDAITGKDIDAY